MKRNNVLWFAITLLITFSGGIYYVLINFLIWEDGKSLDNILLFNLVVIACRLAGTVAASLIGKFLPFTYVFSIASLVRVASIIFIILNINDITGGIVLIGAITGLSSKMMGTAQTLIRASLFNAQELLKFSSVIEMATSVIIIITPLIINRAIEIAGYESSFYGLVIPYLLLATLVLGLHIEHIPQRFSPQKFMKEARYDSRVQRVILITFTLGIGLSFGSGLFNILVLDTVGSLSGWTQVSFGLAILGIGLAYYLKQIDLEQDHSKVKVFITLGTLLYALFPIMLFANFTVFIFISFTVAKQFYDEVSRILTHSLIIKYEREDKGYKQELLYYEFINNFFQTLGAFIPIFILFLLPEEVITTNVLAFTLVLVTFVPFYFVGKLFVQQQPEIDQKVFGIKQTV